MIYDLGESLKPLSMNSSLAFILGKVRMTDKPKISLSIMPTYKCGNRCEYCYLKQPTLGQVYYNNTRALPRKIYKRLKELKESKLML